MSRLLSDRAGNTDQVVILPSALEDPSKSPPGLYRVGLLTACISISAFFIALVIAYYWRMTSHFLLVTASLGAAFLASQLTAWRSLVMHGAFLARNPHISFFYLFTGLHAAHLIGGLVLLFVVVLGSSKRRELVDVATQYWHFLGVLWIALYYVLMTA